MRSIRQFRSRLRNLYAAAAAAAMLQIMATAAAQTTECDCSCEAYQNLRQVMEAYRARADAGETPSFPPEMMRMSQCAGQCAMVWAQCENPDIDMGAMQEAQKRALQQAQQRSSGSSGSDAIARKRAINQRSIGETEKNLQPDETGLPRERLTAEYLEGMWCAVYAGQETTQWRFHADGSYEIGLPAGRGWQMQKGGDTIAEFHDRFDRLTEIEPDGFTTEHRHGRNGRLARLNVFTRGRCN